MMFRRFTRDENGASAVEFAVILSLLVLMTFTVIDLGYALWQWNNAEKATQMGARLAVVSSPVATSLETFDCGNGTLPPGTSCADPGADTFGTITCYGSDPTNCSDGEPFATIHAGAILARVQLLYPAVALENLIFEYEDLRLAYAGRRGTVASVTVRLVDMNFEFIIIDGMLGLGPFPMPDFRTTLTTEDLSSTG